MNGDGVFPDSYLQMIADHIEQERVVKNPDAEALVKSLEEAIPEEPGDEINWNLFDEGSWQDQMYKSGFARGWEECRQMMIDHLRSDLASLDKGTSDD